MSNISKLIEELCPDGVAHLSMGETGSFRRGSGIQKKDFLEDGFPAIHYGQIFTRYGLWAEETFVFVSEGVAQKSRFAEFGDVIIATTSENDEDLAKAVAWLGKSQVAVSSDAMIYSPENLLAKFVSYFLNSTDFQIQKEKYITGTKVRRISSQNFAKIKIPVPPLGIQEEIVRILDRFTLLEAELEAELEARRKQYAFYQQKIFAVKSQFDSSVPSLKILDISKKISAGGDVPSDCMKGQVFPSESHPYPVYSNGSKGNDLYGYSSTYKVEGPCVTVSARGTIGYHAVRDGKFSPIVRLITIVPDISKITVEYLNYVLDITEVGSSGGSIPQLTVPKIKDVEIPVPPLKEQKRIVDILDRFDALVNDISSGLPAEIAARRKQYEHYRDQLLTFKELEPAGS